MSASPHLAFPSRSGLPVQQFNRVRCRVLKPFRYSARRQNATGTITLHLEPTRTVEVGEILEDVIEPDARSWASIGRVELL